MDELGADVAEPLLRAQRQRPRFLLLLDQPVLLGAGGGGLLLRGFGALERGLRGSGGIVRAGIARRNGGLQRSGGSVRSSRREFRGLDLVLQLVALGPHLRQL